MRPDRRVGAEVAAQVGVVGVVRVQFAVLGDELRRVRLGVVLRVVAERTGGREVPPQAGVGGAAVDDGVPDVLGGEGRVEEPGAVGRGSSRPTASVRASARRKQEPMRTETVSMPCRSQ